MFRSLSKRSSFGRFTRASVLLVFTKLDKVSQKRRVQYYARSFYFFVTLFPSVLRSLLLVNLTRSSYFFGINPSVRKHKKNW